MSKGHYSKSNPFLQSNSYLNDHKTYVCNPLQYSSIQLNDQSLFIEKSLPPISTYNPLTNQHSLVDRPPFIVKQKNDIYQKQYLQNLIQYGFKRKKNAFDQFNQVISLNKVIIDDVHKKEIRSSLSLPAIQKINYLNEVRQQRKKPTCNSGVWEQLEENGRKQFLEQHQVFENQLQHNIDKKMIQKQLVKKQAPYNKRPYQFQLKNLNSLKQAFLKREKSKFQNKVFIEIVEQNNLTMDLEEFEERVQQMKIEREKAQKQQQIRL